WRRRHPGANLAAVDRIAAATPGRRAPTFRNRLHIRVEPRFLLEQEFVVVPLHAKAHVLALVRLPERDAGIGPERERIDGLQAIPLVADAILPALLRAERDLDAEERERHRLRALQVLARHVAHPVRPDDADPVPPPVEEPLVEREGHAVA